MTDAFDASFAARTARSQRTVTVDNLLRKTLRVSDPRDPAQIAQALLARYPDEAERNRLERTGLPYSAGRPQQTADAVSAGAAGIELETARSDLERDLQCLASASQLKDIAVELGGWGRAVRHAAAEGLAAARLAIDASNHDVALAARRTLSEYARLARYLGAVTPDGGDLRRFAQSCDVLGALILVAIGEGMAAGGITRSTSLVRVAASELQARRNAVIIALRNLTGSIESSLGQEDYPRGIVGYQSLVAALEQGGQADLRALLEENALAAAMDQLVDLTNGASVSNLRELATTSAILLQRFTRLIQYGRSVPVPYRRNSDRGDAESPPVLSFVAALQLFVDAFSGGGSNRLLYVARPPILAYGIYDAADDDPSATLLELTATRGKLAKAIDCFAGCGCDTSSRRCIIVMDFATHMLDRAIDLWAVGRGNAGDGEPERRAIAAGLLLDEAFKLIENAGGVQGKPAWCNLGKSGTDARSSAISLLVTPFRAPGSNKLRDADSIRFVSKELRIAYRAEQRTEELIRNLTPGCPYPEIFTPRLGRSDASKKDSLVRHLIRRTMNRYGDGGPIEIKDRIELPQPLAQAASAQAFNHSEFKQI